MDNNEILHEEIEAEEIEEELEDEMEYDEVRLLMLAMQAFIVLLGYLATMPRRIERPVRRSITRAGTRFVRNMLDGDQDSFRYLYRMPKDVFLRLCSIIKEKTNLRDTRFITVEEMVATFLLIVGHNDRYGNVRQRFGRSHYATSRNFNKVLTALNIIAPDMMAKPSTGMPAKIQESTRFNPYFKDCIGAIDGTHIPATVVGRDVSSYRNRHGIQSQNVLAACNFDLQFMYVLSGWEGSAHDSKLLHDALSRPDGLQVPQGKYYLVDCGFANRRQFLAPLRSVRYHLKDFGGQGRQPTNASELFNLRRASLRNVIERIFEIFHVDPVCSLCEMEMESLDHLFFQCSFSRVVSEEVYAWSGNRRVVGCWADEKRYMELHCKNKGCYQTMYRLVTSVVIYQLWKERNYNRFKGQAQDARNVIRACQIIVALRFEMPSRSAAFESVAKLE